MLTGLIIAFVVGVLTGQYIEHRQSMTHLRRRMAEIDDYSQRLQAAHRKAERKST